MKQYWNKILAIIELGNGYMGVLYTIVFTYVNAWIFHNLNFKQGKVFWSILGKQMWPPFLSVSYYTRNTGKAEKETVLWRESPIVLHYQKKNWILNMPAISFYGFSKSLSLLLHLWNRDDYSCNTWSLWGLTRIGYGQMRWACKCYINALFFYLEVRLLSKLEVKTTI